jgi:hypothetical protein
VIFAALHICVTTSSSCASGNPLLTTLLPAVIGAVLAFGASLVLRRGERQWQLSRDRFAQQIEVIKPLDDALVEAQRKISDARGAEAGPDWSSAHDSWENVWVRLTPHLTDAEVEARFEAVGTILKELMLADLQPRRGSAVMVVMRAIANARLALAYWLRGDALPAASFPSPKQTIELLGQGDPEPFAAGSALRRWLEQHEQPPWRPEPSTRWWKTLSHRADV